MFQKMSRQTRSWKEIAVLQIALPTVTVTSVSVLPARNTQLDFSEAMTFPLDRHQ